MNKKLHIWTLIILAFVHFWSYSQNCTTVTPSFSYSMNHNGCNGPDTIQFTNTSTGSAVSTSTYYWVIDNSVFDTTNGLASPDTLIRNNGSYNILLVVITPTNCYDTFSQILNITPQPNANFTMISNSLCLGSISHFTNTSTNTSTNSNYTWIFGDGGTSTNDDTVTHMYLSTGAYTVTLIAANSVNCSDSVSKSITVVNGSSPIRLYDDFGTPQTTITWSRCIVLTTSPDSFIQVFGSPDTLFNYVFYFGDGTSTSGDTLLPYSSGGMIQHTYLTIGEFDFMVTDQKSSGCQRVFHGQVINLRVPTVGIGGPTNGMQNGCAPINIPFKNTSSSISGTTTFTWDFGDGTIVQYDSTNKGDSVFHAYMTTICNIYVTLTATNQCGSTQSTWGPINAYDIDEARFSTGGVLCYPDTTFTLIINSDYNCYSGTRYYNWDFGDGTNTGWSTIGVNQNHSFPGPGTYSVTFIDSNACGVDSATETVAIYLPPDASFISDTVCLGDTTHFFDSSTILSGQGNIINHIWTIDDSIIISNPIQQTIGTGTNEHYRYGPIYRSSSGSSSDFSRYSYLYTASELSALGIPNGAEIRRIAWYKTSTFNISNTGNAYLDLFMKNSSQSQLTIGTPWLSVISGASNVLSTTFNTGNNLPASTGWTFFNLTTPFIYSGNALEISANWDISGVANNPTNGPIRWRYLSGLSGTYTIGEVGSSPPANLNNSTNSGNVRPNIIIEYALPANNPTYVFTNPGVHKVNLYIETEYGCSDDITDSVYVIEAPTVSFVTFPGLLVCDTNTISFSGTATSTTSPIDSILWSFGDGLSDTALNTSHTYSSNGSYNVTLRAVNQNQCEASTTQLLTIYSSPIANFTADTVCIGSNTSFTDYSTTMDLENISSWQWDFTSDGSPDDTIQNPNNYYPSFGSYNVSLRIETEFGCVDTDTQIVYVNQSPIINFSPNDSSVCQFDNITFYNNSTIADSFIWNYGDGSAPFYIGNTSSTIHQYNTTGNYYVTLKGITNDGCESSDSINIYVSPHPTALFTSPDTIGCSPFTINIFNNSTFADSFEWYLNGNLISTSQNLTSQILQNPEDTIRITLIVKNQYACIPDTFSILYYTFPKPSAGFTYTPQQGCGPLNVSFTNTSIGSNSYYWDFGTGYSSYLQDPSYTFNPATLRDTIYIINLYSYNSFNCVDSIANTVLVYPKPISSFTLSDNTGCPPHQVNFTNISYPNDTGTIADMTFLWDFGNGDTSILQDPSEVFINALNQDTTYYITLYAFSEHNCIDTSVKMVRVFSKPTVQFVQSDSTGCGPLVISFTNTSIPHDSQTIDDMSFIWDFGDGTTDTSRNYINIFNAATTFDTIYTITLFGTDTRGCIDSFKSYVKVYPDPAALFVVDDSTGCGPLTVNFTNNSYPNDTGTINDMSFLWNLGNGMTTTLMDTSATYIQSIFRDSIYTVILIALNEHNCSDTNSKNIRVYPVPIVDFVPDKSSGCSPLDVQFTNLSFPKDTGSINDMTFYWNFDNGANSLAQDPSATFFNALTQDTIYNVKLIGYSEHSCIDSVSYIISVYPDPDVSFSQLVYNGCGPLPEDFINTSVPNDTGTINNMTFLWDFGDGNSSTMRNASNTYYSSITQDSIYQIILTGYSEHGCIDKDSGYVRIYPKPVADFAISDHAGCGPHSVIFTNTSYPMDTGTINDMTFVWNFGNGINSVTQDTTITFIASLTQDTSYTITLTSFSEHNCVDSSTDVVIVYPKPNVQFYQSDFTGCGPLEVTFVNTSIANGTFTINDMAFEWDYGNGFSSTSKDSAIKYFAAIGSDIIYSISLIGSTPHGCLDTFVSEVRIHPNPESDFIHDSNSCGRVIFTNTSLSNDTSSMNDMNFFWNFAFTKTSTSIHDTVTFKASLIQDTTYMISLVSTNSYGCIDTINKEVIIRPTPVLGFNASPVEDCGVFDVSFTNYSTNTDTFLWLFGDGDSSIVVNPSHTYSNFTTKTVNYFAKLTGVSKYGCPGDTFSKQIIAHPLPTAGFRPNIDTGCGPLTVNFFNTSINSMAFEWDLGHGKQSASTSPFGTYLSSINSDTTYYITLIAYDTIFGCADTMTKSITIFQQPVVEFTVTPTSGCSPLTVFFDNRSTGAVEYLWNFSDGNISTDENPTHIFLNNNFFDITYEVFLYALSSHNCFDSAKKSITVNYSPLALFSMDKIQGCAPLEVNFLNNSVNADSYSWNFGDGNISSAENPGNSYQSQLNDTTYTATLTARTSAGCTDTMSADILVHQKIIADFNEIESGCEPLSVQFDDLSTNAKYWTWYFGDGNASSLQNPIHNYNIPGTYSVRLQVTSKNGCIDTFTMIDNIEVWKVPKADFFADKYYTQIPKLTFNFSSLSNPNNFHKWDFGDGKLSLDVNPIHIYLPDTGTYIVTLLVQNDHCSDTISKYLRIDPPIPHPGFYSDPKFGCVPLKVSFLDTSKYADLWFWYFGDGETSTERNPIHIYKIPGTYSVTLVTENKIGRSSRFEEDMVVVFPKPHVDFKPDPTVVYLPDAKVHMINLTVGAASYDWYLNGRLADTSREPTFYLFDYGSYDIMLIGTSEHGCKDSMQKYSVIRVDSHGLINVPNAFTPDGDGLNDIFIPIGYGYSSKDYHFEIYNRWGERVFETDHYEIGWDGTFKGELCENELYYWIVTVKLYSEDSAKFDGKVHLLK